MRRILWILGLNLFILNYTGAEPIQSIRIVAAENFYGELAREIGGKLVDVQSIINNPNADPHLFTTTPSISRSLAQAQIIIYNGANYDAWMDQILGSLNQSQPYIIINVANLMGIKPGANPHIWYNPKTFPKLAVMLATAISRLNPGAAKDINDNLNNFLHANQQLNTVITKIKNRCSGVEVIATEPIFGYMTSAMGLKMRGNRFQWKIMNDTEPSPSIIVKYQDLLNAKRVKILFYNNQVTNGITKNMQNLAQKNHIPLIGISETIPPNTLINAWLINEAVLTNNALGKCK